MAAKKHKRKPAPRKKKRTKRATPCPAGIFPVHLSCGSDGVTSANPNKVNKVSKKAKDEVKWHSGTHFTVDFDQPEGTPFASNHFEGGPGSPAYSGEVLSTNYRNYKYTAKVDDYKALDPIIHTDP